MGMVQQFHDLNFAVDFLEVRFIQLCFVDDLNGDLGKTKKGKSLRRMRATRVEF